MPDAPVIITSAFTPPSPSAPAAVASAFSAGSASAPAVVTGAFSAGTPTAPKAITSAFSAGSPSAPAEVKGSFSPGSPTAPVVVQGAPETCIVTGTLTGDGSTPVVFPYLYLVGQRTEEESYYSSTGAAQTGEDDFYFAYVNVSMGAVLAKRQGLVTLGSWIDSGPMTSNPENATWSPDPDFDSTGTPDCTLINVRNAASAPVGITSAFSAGSPSAPLAITSAYTPPTPSAPPAITT